MGLRTPIHTGYQPRTTPIEGHRHGYRAIPALRPPPARRPRHRSGPGPRRCPRCRRERRPHRRGGQEPAGPGEGDGRCARQAGAARPDRHPRPRLPLCQRPLRARRRYRGRPFRRDHGGRPGRTLGADLPRLPRVCRQARQHPRARLHLRLHGGRAGRSLLPRALPPRLHRRRRHGARGPRQRRPGARREGPCRDRRLHALGRRGDAPRRRDRPRARPAALHPFRPALALARRQASLRCRRHPARHAENPAAGRYPGPSLHPPSRRLRRPARQGPSDGARGAGARPEDRRRPRLAFLLQDGAAGARGRPRARHAGRRHARLQHDDPQAARHARDASRQGGDAPLRRRAELLAGLGHDQHAGPRPLARAGRADGDQQLRRHAGHDGRDRHAQARRRGRRVGAGRRERPLRAEGQ